MCSRQTPCSSPLEMPKRCEMTTPAALASTFESSFPAPVPYPAPSSPTTCWKRRGLCTRWVLGSSPEPPRHWQNSHSSCAQNQGERGYHIFYELVEGADEELQRKLHLQNTNFKYLCNGRNFAIGGRSDAAEFKVTQDCLSRIGLPESAKADIFTMIAAVLHLGKRLSFRTSCGQFVARDV